jgi:hypothetical protein
MIDEATLVRTAASGTDAFVAAAIPAAAVTAAAASVPLSSNPQEEQFLKSRLARFNDNNHHHHDTTTRKNTKRDALHAFWTILRRKLSHWNKRLVTVEETYQNNANTDDNNNNNNKNTTNNNNHNNSNSNKQDGLDALERLRLELEQWRKHCMSMSTASTTSSTSTTIPTIINGVDSSDSNKKEEEEDDKWLVPEELSLTDLKLLHGELTKCSDQWEAVRDRLFPKGKFIFRRYREALARRNIRQDDFAAQDQTKQNEKVLLRQRHSPLETAHNNYGTGGAAVLENLSHVTVVIDPDGKVQATTIQPITNATFQVDECTNATTTVVDHNSTNNSTRKFAGKTVRKSLPQISSSSLLIRNLQHGLVIL